MTEAARCPLCDAEIPDGAPAGLCPKCLLQGGLDSRPPVGPEFPPTQPSRSRTSGFVPPAPDELSSQFPQLEVLELLGRGGMGAVYKAKQRGLDRLVALKILPPEVSRDPAFAERFTREARALAKLTHSNIVSVYDFGQADGLFYFLMEYVDGVNLRQAIQAGEMTPQEALAIVPQICEALQFAHDEGIVHRDIKPENILIDKRGRVKIADFGLAKLKANGGRESPVESLTATHQVMGTLRYMAPEQMQGTRDVDHRADIYSLGVVFYELLTGELPMGRFAPPSKRVQVDVRLDEVVLRALEQDPEQRYQHASDVKSEIDSIRTTPAPPKPVKQRDPLEPFPDESDRFAMTPNPSYAKRVGIPSAILLGLFLAVTIAAHSVYGQKDNYQEQTLVWILSNGAILFWLGVIILNITFFARRSAAKTETDPDSTCAGTPLTQMRFAVTGSANVADHAVFHFSSLGYELAERRANVCVFRRGGQWAGLWEFDIRKYATRLTVRTAPGAEGQQWVSCDWSVRTLGAWITRRDIRQLEAEGEGFMTLLGVPPASDQPIAGPESQPLFSSFAIVGVVWAIFGLLTVIPVLYFIGLNRVWNGTALPTDVIHSEPPLAFSIFMGALLVIGSGAPIGTTIYGGIAIAHIQRSGGQIIGLSLAVADVLFFPLLVLGGIIAFIAAQIWAGLAPHSNATTVYSAASFGVLVGLMVCFFVARAVWRAVARPLEVQPK